MLRVRNVWTFDQQVSVSIATTVIHICVARPEGVGAGGLLYQ